MVKYDRIAKIKTHHMAISLQWLKDTNAPEYHAVQLLQKHKNKIIKFANLHVPEKWHSINDCCYPCSDATVDLMDICKLYKRQTSLEEEFDNIEVHHYVCIARNSIHDAAIYSIHALDKAQRVLADFQCKLIADPRSQKTMDISFGEELKHPLSINIAKNLTKVYFPTKLDI